MLLEWGFLIFLGLSGGLAVGSGLVAFISVLGVIPRLAQLTRSAFFIEGYEWAVISGAICASLLSLHGWTFSLPALLVVPIGLAAGIFVGMLAAALTEVLNVFPVLAKRIHVDGSITKLIMAIVLGKIFGSLFHWLYFVDL